MKITESRIRQIIREEASKLTRRPSALSKRRGMREAMTRGAWTYDENGVGLDGGGEVADAWEQFTEACVMLSRFADMSFPEADLTSDANGPDSGDRRSGLHGEMVSVLEMAKYQINAVMDGQ